MQIDPKLGASLPPLPSTSESPGSGPIVGATDGRAISTSFAPTALLATLYSELKRLPEVRAEVVRQLRERLAKGDVVTAGVAFEIAEAILGAETADNR